MQWQPLYIRIHRWNAPSLYGQWHIAYNQCSELVSINVSSPLKASFISVQNYTYEFLQAYYTLCHLSLHLPKMSFPKTWYLWQTITRQLTLHIYYISTWNYMTKQNSRQIIQKIKISFNLTIYKIIYLITLLVGQPESPLLSFTSFYLIHHCHKTFPADSKGIRRLHQWTPYQYYRVLID